MTVEPVKAASTVPTSHWPADTTHPVLETTVGGVLREAAAQAADSLALVEGVAQTDLRRRWTFADLMTESERVARALLGRFSPGERVAVWAPNCPEWVLLEFGLGLAGITLVTVNPAFRAQELEYVLRQSRSNGLVLAPNYRGSDLTETLAQVRAGLPNLREVVSLGDWEGFVASGVPTERLPEVQPDDAAQIQYTSGTTGFPKGAVLHHRGITNNARFTYEVIAEATPDDLLVNPYPFFHTAGCVLSTLGAVQSQFPQVVPPEFDPGLMLHLIESERGTVLTGVPTMLLALLEHPDFPGRDLSSVRMASSGGATVAPTLAHRIESALGVPLTIVFGQTEASPLITQIALRDSPDDRAHTVGRPQPQVEVRIADIGTGETVVPGGVGEILTRGYHVMKGYFDNPAATSDAIDARGWLHTGDLGSMDERGYCRIEGRVKEVIIRGGENIYPREIEHVLLTHATVGDVAVVGVPDDYWGEQVAAFIRPAPGQTPSDDELFAYCRQHLAAHKTPRHWRFVEAFPLTPSGKVRKFVLQEQFNAGAGAVFDQDLAVERANDGQVR